MKNITTVAAALMGSWWAPNPYGKKEPRRHPRGGRTYKPNGKRERIRRLGQIANGQIRVSE